MLGCVNGYCSGGHTGTEESGQVGLLLTTRSNGRRHDERRGQGTINYCRTENSMGIARKDVKKVKRGALSQGKGTDERQGLAAWDWKFFHHHSRAPALCSFWCTASGWFLSPCSITYRRRNGMRGMVGCGLFFSCIGGVSCPPFSVARIGAGQISRPSHSRATGQATALTRVRLKNSGQTTLR